MKGFKTYLAEIDHDDSVYGKAASAWNANFRIDDSWEPLPLKGTFWKPGYICYWRHWERTRGWKLAVAYHKQVVISIELDLMTARVPGGELTGLEVDSLSSSASVRGTGLVLRTYEALVESGQVLFSSDSQTTGSRQLWSKLVQSPKVVPFVFAKGEAAEWYIKRFGSDEIKEQMPANVLLTGSMAKMSDEAYASQETRWLVLPTDLPGLDGLRDGSIDLG
jgi:hypothetical protein